MFCTFNPYDKQTIESIVLIAKEKIIIGQTYKFVLSNNIIKVIEIQKMIAFEYVETGHTGFSSTDVFLYKLENNEIVIC